MVEIKPYLLKVEILDEDGTIEEKIIEIIPVIEGSVKENGIRNNK